MGGISTRFSFVGMRIGRHVISTNKATLVIFILSSPINSPPQPPYPNVMAVLANYNILVDEQTLCWPDPVPRDPQEVLRPRIVHVRSIPDVLLIWPSD